MRSAARRMTLKVPPVFTLRIFSKTSNLGAVQSKISRRSVSVCIFLSGLPKFQDPEFECQFLANVLFIQVKPWEGWN